MATKNSFCLDEEELSCPICFEEFNLCEKNRQPKLLLCLHTFCLACVETLRKYDGSLQCSICRTSHHVHRVGELMDNYVIFEYLRCKQEYEDGKLAAQLKEEYDKSFRLIKEQEEKDAHLARLEHEKSRLEEERIRAEAEKERLKLEEVRRKEEKERSQREEEWKRREEEAEQEFTRQNQLQNIAQINYIPSVYESSTESLVDVTSEEMTDSEKEDIDEEEDGDIAEDEEDASFQEFEEQNERDLDEEEEASSSQTSVVDVDAYETLSSDESEEEEHCSTEIISSDDEDEMGTALSTTAPLPSRNPRTSCDYSPSTSPEPDLLSEEFSGVAQTHHRAKPPPEALDKLLPSVKCSERNDGSIIILDSSLEGDSDISTLSPQNPNRIILSRLTISAAGESEDDPGNSSDEEAQVGLTAAGASKSKPFRMEQSVANARENDENCKMQ